MDIPIPYIQCTYLPTYIVNVLDSLSIVKVEFFGVNKLRHDIFTSFLFFSLFFLFLLYLNRMNL